MIDPKTALDCVRRMSALNFFPREDEAKTAIAECVMDMCNAPQEAYWLARRMLELYNEWPGPREMRAAFCSKYIPRDKHEVNSTVYGDGIPSEKNNRPALPPPLPNQINGGSR